MTSRRFGTSSRTIVTACMRMRTFDPVVAVYLACTAHKFHTP
jgi:hypothetical protein